MKRAVRLGFLAGFVIAGAVALLEALWLMGIRDLTFGVFRESLYLLASLGTYLLVGALLGIVVAVIVAAGARSLGRHLRGPELFVSTCAGSLALLVGTGLATLAFRKILPTEVGIAEPRGILTLIIIGAVSALTLLASRWVLLKFLGRFLDRRIEGRTFPIATVSLVILPLVALSGVHHVRTAHLRSELDRPSAGGDSAAQSLPNVILITLDTVRAESCPLYGYHRPTTPNLSAFASTAVTYEDVIAHSAWTLPSHSTIFTGRYPSELSETWGSKKLGETHVTLAEILRSKGYRTGGVIGGPFCSGSRGLSQGFDYYEDNLPKGIPFLSLVLNKVVANLFSVAAKRRADQINEFAFRWLERNSSSPFFLFINYFDAHLPLNPPFPARTAFEGSFGLVHSALVSQGDIEFDVTQGKRDLSERERRHWLTQYDREILFADYGLGRLLEKLKTLGAYENSLIVVTSDHGHSYGEHHLMGHSGWIFEEVVRVPLVIRYPGGKGGGTRVAGRMGLVDLFPLVLETLGLPVPPTAHYSADPDTEKTYILENNRRHPLRRLEYAYGGKDLRAIYWGPYKLVTVDGEAAELYDLETDPGESANLLSEERGVADTLARKLSEFLEHMHPPPEEGEEGMEDLKDQLRAVGYLL